MSCTGQAQSSAAHTQAVLPWAHIFLTSFHCLPCKLVPIRAPLPLRTYADGACCTTCQPCPRQQVLNEPFVVGTYPACFFTVCTGRTSPHGWCCTHAGRRAVYASQTQAHNKDKTCLHIAAWLGTCKYDV